jgi:hypothetical protein
VFPIADERQSTPLKREPDGQRLGFLPHEEEIKEAVTRLFSQEIRDEWRQLPSKRRPNVSWEEEGNDI